MQLCKVVLKEKVWEYNSVKLPQMGRFWEYNLVELPQRKCFENTTPQSCLKGNIFIIQFSKIASKGIFWDYNSAELPQRKCFKNTIKKRSPKFIGLGLKIYWADLDYNMSIFVIY